MYFSPEAVLMQSGLDAPSVAAFLHENFLHLIDDSAIDDVAIALDYMSLSGKSTAGMQQA